MTLRAWISDQLHSVVGFTTPAVVDYLIAQATAPSATAAQLEVFLQQSLADGADKAAHVQSFARELIERVPKKAATAARGAAADEERRRREAVRRNDTYTLVEDARAEEGAMGEEDEHRRRMREARQRDKEARAAEKVKRRDRRSHSSDDEDERPAKRLDTDAEREQERRMEEEEKEEKKEGDGGEDELIASMTPAEAIEYRKQQDRQARDAFIARLAERDKAKTKQVAADKGAQQRDREDRELSSMTQDEMRALLPQLRRKAREQYLTRREQQQLQLLQLTLDDEQGRWKEEELTEKERRELGRRRKLLELAQQRKGLSDEVVGYRMPEAYVREDGTEDLQKRQAVLERRYVEEKKVESEYEGWEREQSKKSQLSVGSKKAEPGQQYDYVFDEEQIEFVRAEMMAGTDAKAGQPTVKEEAATRALSEFEQLQESRRKLPIYPYRAELLAAVRQYQVLIIVGETGSGKTTQVMQYLYEDGYCSDGKMVGCTQPRRVAAMSVAARVAQEMGVKLGHEVGYSIRFEDCTSERTRVKYLTDGMLLREFLNSPDLAPYSLLMIDEAHERTLSTDILFGLIKDIARYRSDLKVLISSATLDAEKFSDYFDKAPIFIIPGRRYPVDIYYTKAPEADYIDAAIVTVLQIHTTQPRGDILVFLTGQEEIESMQDTLTQRAKKLPHTVDELLVLPIYSSLPSEQQAKIFAPTPPRTRKVVLATNIAETSLTIDGIVYVIDPGFQKVNSYNARTGMESLAVAPVSRASANQRAGRAGRVSAGKCFRLYTASAYRDELEENSVPEIQRVNLCHVVLMLKSLGVDDLLHFDYMDAPPSETLIQAFTQLYALGALNDSGELTRLGRRMAELPMDPQLAKMLLGSEQYGCSEEMLSVCAMLGVGQGITHRPKDKAVAADTAHRLLQHRSGDHLTLLNMYSQWEESDYSAEWCYDHYIQLRAMKRARDIREQLASLAQRVELQLLSHPLHCTDHSPLLKAITSGFFYQIARLDKTGVYRTVRKQQTVYIHPSSALGRRGGEGEGRSDMGCVLYHELVLTKKEYMRVVSVVDMQWLAEIAPHLYTKKDMDEQSGKRKMPKGQGKPSLQQQ